MNIILIYDIWIIETQMFLQRPERYKPFLWFVQEIQADKWTASPNHKVIETGPGRPPSDPRPRGSLSPRKETKVSGYCYYLFDIMKDFYAPAIRRMVEGH